MKCCKLMCASKPAGKRVLSLDVGLLVAGAKERGELESRVTNILSECREAGDVILMCAPKMLKRLLE